MKLNVRGEKIEVTKSMENYLEEKLKKIEKYYENPDNVEVKAVLKVTGINSKIEVTLKTSSFTLRAEETNPDMYAAIDLVVDKLEMQIRKNKSKIKSKMNREKIVEFSYFDFEEEEEPSDIVKRKVIELKPMDEEEAILQMELLGHNFFVFKNVDVSLDNEGKIIEMNVQRRRFIFFSGGVFKIKWSQIDKIGKDVILVNVNT